MTQLSNPSPDNRELDPRFAAVAMHAVRQPVDVMGNRTISAAGIEKCFGMESSRAQRLLKQLAQHKVTSSCRGNCTVIADEEKVQELVDQLQLVVPEAGSDPGIEAEEAAASCLDPDCTDDDESISPREPIGMAIPEETDTAEERPPSTSPASPTTRDDAPQPETKEEEKQSKTEPSLVWLEQEPELQELPLEEIRIKKGIQCRERMDLERADDYTQQMHAGAKFPPIVVFKSKGTLWLADGFHRLEAAKRIKAATIQANLYQGSRQQALLYAAGANAHHGLNRSNKDKRRAIALVLKEEPNWSNKWISGVVGVTDKTVAVVRRELEGTSEIPRCTRRQTRDGREMDTVSFAKAAARDAVPVSAELDEATVVAQAGEQPQVAEVQVGVAHDKHVVLEHLVEAVARVEQAVDTGLELAPEDRGVLDDLGHRLVRLADGCCRDRSVHPAGVE